MDSLKNRLKKSKGLVRTVRKIKQILTKNPFTSKRPNPFMDIMKLSHLIHLKNPVFIDGGAHNGSTILKIRDDGFHESEIYAFEPITEAAEAIAKFNDSKVFIHKTALSDKDGQVEFHINSRAVTSSILGPDEVEKYHPGLASLKKKITVPCAKLDTLIESKKIPQPDIIKLDLQGFELYALKGAEKILTHVKMVLCEAEFVPLYKNQPLFDDISLYMRSRGFSLFNIYNIGNHENGQILSADALFLNDAYFKK